MTLVSQGSILLPSDLDRIMEAEHCQQQPTVSSQPVGAAAANGAGACAEQQALGSYRPEHPSSAAAVVATCCEDDRNDLLSYGICTSSSPVKDVAAPVSTTIMASAFIGESTTALAVTAAVAELTGPAVKDVGLTAASLLSGARGDWSRPGAGVDHVSLHGLRGNSQRDPAAVTTTATIRGGASLASSGGTGCSAHLPSLGGGQSDVQGAGLLRAAEGGTVHHQLAAGATLASPGCMGAATTPSLDCAADAVADFGKGSPYRSLPEVGGWPLEMTATATLVAGSTGSNVFTLPRVVDGLSSDEGGDGTDNEGAGSISQAPGGQRGGLPDTHDSDEDAACFILAHNRHMSTKSSSEREAVRMIIDDIRQALSKLPSDVVSADTSSSLRSQPVTDDVATDVWVVRDSYSEKLRRQDEQRRARIDMEKRYEEEFRRKQAEEVYHLEFEDTKLMMHQQLEENDQQAGGTVQQARPAKPTTSIGGAMQQPAGVAEYSEHDRDIAGNWFLKKGKYRQVLASDSDSDGCEDISGAATSAVAAPLPSSYRQAASVSRVCHAARLADYRGCMGGRHGDGEQCPVAGAAASIASAEPQRRSKAATTSRMDTASGLRSPAAASGSCSMAPVADRSPLASREQQPPLLSGHGAVHSSTRSRQPPAAVTAVHNESGGSSAASDGSGYGDDDYDDVDDADDDLDGSGKGSELREQRRHHPHQRATASAARRGCNADYDTDDETDRLVQNEYRTADGGVHIPEREAEEVKQLAKRNKAKEVAVYDPDDPTVLIEGILFRASYLGSTQLVSEVQPSKAMRMMQAQEAVGRIKAPDGESQPSTDVDLFVSTEKVMVLNTNLKEIIMDHSLRSISYIADIENVLVVMAKRSMISSPGDDTRTKKQQKLICHVFDTDEAQLIAKSIGQAFQVAYMEFLKANGIDDPGLLKETTYEDILNQQEIAHDELDMFTRREMQKEVVISKARGEALGIVVVESGWGSMLPTVVLANMSALGPATRCGQLNIGDQIMAVNGTSLVGLPLSTCQDHIKGVRSQTVVKLTVVSRPPVVDVLIKRPDVKYQLGFSVQNGVICSLLRGGIAERGGVRVGHRIIEINGQSVVATSHEKIVYTLSTSIGEIRMKTMPMSIFRLLTGQEMPHYI